MELLEVKVADDIEVEHPCVRSGRAAFEPSHERRPPGDVLLEQAVRDGRTAAERGV